VDSPCSGQRPVAGCCECGDEPLGSGATGLVSYQSETILILSGITAPKGTSRLQYGSIA
jgi:hypothetical protein